MGKAVSKFTFWTGMVVLWLAMMVNQFFVRNDIRELKEHPCQEQVK